MPCDCPKCDKSLNRTRRQAWMRRIPGSTYCVCKGCGDGYLLIFNR